MKIDINVAYEPQGETLREFYNCPADPRFHFIRGPEGSGKTTAVCHKILRMMLEMPVDKNGCLSSKAMATRTTYPELMTTTLQDWKNFMKSILAHDHDDPDYYQIGRWDMNTPYTHIIDGIYQKHGQKNVRKVSEWIHKGSKVRAEMMFLPLLSESDIQKLRGYHLSFAWISECQFSSWEVIEAVSGRVGRYPRLSDVDHAQWPMLVLGDTNSCEEDCWFYVKAEREKPPNIRFYHQPGGVVKDRAGRYVLNPKAENLKNLPRDYYSNRLLGTQGNRFRMMTANEYGYYESGSAVFQEFDAQWHVSGDLEYSGADLFVGMDFGLWPAAVIIQREIDGHGFEQVRVLDEIVPQDPKTGSEPEHGTSTREFAPMLKRRLMSIMQTHGIEAYSGAGDPKGDDRDTHSKHRGYEVLRNGGIFLRKAHTNDPTERLGVIHQMLVEGHKGKPKLIIHERCRVLTQAFAGRYAWARKQIRGHHSATISGDMPKGYHSHVMDALQYALLGMGFSASKRADRGDVSLSTFGSRDSAGSGRIRKRTGWGA